MDAGVASQWRQAAEFDATLKAPDHVLDSLEGLRLGPIRYSRRRLFSAMARQQPVVFSNFPVRASLHPYFFEGTSPSTRLRSLFSGTATTMAKTGRSRRARHLPVHDVIDRWERGRGLVSANDIFFRRERMDRAFDCSALSDFNVIPTASPAARDTEVATFLMGTPGCFTDSHSDDPDGCNYCIVGTKLWLVWDRNEGRARGLEDCEYDEVYDQAAFDMETFAGVRSARWFTISTGETLFLPGNLTHKVITLGRYMGISSFYVGLPNALTSASRWIVDGAQMMTTAIRGELLRRVVRRIDAAARGSQALRHQCGFSHLREAYEYWAAVYADHREALLADKAVRALAERSERCAYER